jgi:hypothetical protein
MDERDALRAAHDRARARSLDLLERTEHAAAENVTAEPRDDDDDVLLSWRRGMPEPEPERHERRASREKLTDSEAARWQTYIDGKIAAANAERDKLWRDVLGAVVAEVRKQLRAEITAAVGSVWHENSAEIEKVDLRLMALIGELTKRRIETPNSVFQLPRGAQRFTHGFNGNA